MNAARRVSLFIFIETISMGLFFWIGGALESLWLHNSRGLFSEDGLSLIVMGGLMSLPFIFAGALLCAFLSVWFRTTYFRIFCLVVGFASLFPFVFVKKIESAAALLPGSMGLILWFILSDLLRVRIETYNSVK